MKTIFFAFILIFLQSAGLYAVSINQLEQYFENEQYEDLRREVRRVSNEIKHDPAVLYFLAFTSNAPDSALSLYQRVAENFPSSKYADQALYRLGQYNFFTGNYTQARHSFARLLRGYSKSYLKDDAQYLYCQCILAQGKEDSAKVFLKAFVQNVRRSPYVDSAILDLESLGGVSITLPTAPAKSQQKDYYSIRVASFSSFESAKNALFKLSKIYPHVEVGELRLGTTDYYLVYLGRFETFDKAQQYAQLYIEPHLQEYKIMQRRP